MLPYCCLLEPCELLGKARIYTVDLYLVYKVVLQTEPPPKSTSLPLWTIVCLICKDVAVTASRTFETRRVSFVSVNNVML